MAGVIFAALKFGFYLTYSELGYYTRGFLGVNPVRNGDNWGIKIIFNSLDKKTICYKM